MASFKENLKIIIGVDTKDASSGLKGLVKDVGNADGVMGKLKAGAGGLKDMFNELGTGAKAGIAAGGVAAVGAAMFEVTQKAADLGLKIGDVRDQTGLSADEASRWVEVGDSMGISAETLEGILGKMNKNLDPGLMKQYGIETAHTKDGQVDVNQTFLNTIERLHDMKNAGDQARAGTALFGRGWQSVAELVSEGAETVKGKLDSVEKQKIFSDDKIEQARKFRDQMDDLGDKIEDVELSVGQALIPIMTKLGGYVASAAGDIVPLVDGLSDLVGAIDKIPEPIKLTFEVVSNPIAAIGAIKSAVTDVSTYAGVSGEDLNKMLAKWGTSAEESSKIIEQWRKDNHLATDTLLLWSAGLDAGTPKVSAHGDAIRENAVKTDAYYASLEQVNAEFDKTNDTWDGAKTKAVDLASATKRASDAADHETLAAKEQRDALDRLSESMVDNIQHQRDLERGSLDLATAVLDLKDKTADTDKVIKDSKATAEDKQRALIGLRQAQLDAADSAITQAEKEAGITSASSASADQIRIEIGRLQDMAAKYPELRSEIDEYIAKLNAIPSVKNTTITLTNPSGNYGAGAGAGYSNKKTFAKGGTYGPGDLVNVAEAGQSEIINEGGKSYIIGGAPGSVTPLPKDGTGAGGGSYQMIVHGNVYGDAHLERLFREHEAKMVQQLNAGKR